MIKLGRQQLKHRTKSDSLISKAGQLVNAKALMILLNLSFCTMCF